MTHTRRQCVRNVRMRAVCRTLTSPPPPFPVHTGQAGMRERRGFHGQRQPGRRKARGLRPTVPGHQGLSRPVHPGEGWGSIFVVV